MESEDTSTNILTFNILILRSKNYDKELFQDSVAEYPEK